jgi:hypothetical protein
MRATQLPLGWQSDRADCSADIADQAAGGYTDADITRSRADGAIQVAG